MESLGFAIHMFIDCIISGTKANEVALNMKSTMDNNSYTILLSQWSISILINIIELKIKFSFVCILNI